MLELKNITKYYPNSNRNILDNLSFKVQQGDSIAIVGPSGTGKSTLLNIMSTLDRPNSGEVYFNSTNLPKLSADEQAEFRNQEMGFVFQQHHLLPQLSLLENVLVPTLTERDKDKRQAARKRALELIERVGLSEQVKQKLGQMSVGECQRTAVVRALINEPTILFADEPTGSLDPDSAHLLVDLLMGLNSEKKLSLIMVTHAMDIAQKLKQVYRLQQGKLTLLNES